MSDPFDLDRFVDAQAPLWGDVTAELRAGEKRTHWMWFVFPQLRGLGFSARASYYGLSSLAEARAYAAHPLLGSRLRETVALAVAAPGTAVDVFGEIDAVKLRSCLTLFARAEPDEPVFRDALARVFDGAECSRTLALLARDDTQPGTV